MIVADGRCLLSGYPCAFCKDVFITTCSRINNLVKFAYVNGICCADDILYPVPLSIIHQLGGCATVVYVRRNVVCFVGELLGKTINKKQVDGVK